MHTILRSVIASIFLTLAAALASAASPTVPENACYAGAYKLSNGLLLVITPSEDADLRYRLLDGSSGRLGVEGAAQFRSVPGWSAREPTSVRVTFGDCANGTLMWQWGRAAPIAGARVPQPVVPVHFANGNVGLYGELHLPVQGKPHSVVVLQFGGSRSSAVTDNYLQHLLPLKNIAVFVFDKRGTGQSDGEFSADFETLSEDLAAAVRQVRSMRQVARVPLGLMGESQGGWVVPLAATKTPVDFVIVSYGLAVSIREENRLETMLGLKARGYGVDIQAQAQEVIEASDRIMRSRFREGLEELRRLRDRYGQEPWYRDLSAESMTGDYTSILANTPDKDMEAVRAAFNFAYDLDYDPIPTLRKLKVPSLWVIAGKDTEAPSASTIGILRGLQAQGVPIDVAVFPNADHGIIEVEQTPQGQRELERHSPGYFDLLADWAARHALSDRSFGTAEVTPRR